MLGKASLITRRACLEESIFSLNELLNLNNNDTSFTIFFSNLKPCVVNIFFSLFQKTCVFLVFLVKTDQDIVVPSGIVKSETLLITSFSFPRYLG